MASLVEYSILNGIDNDLVESIKYSGGDPSSAVGVVDLADVIKSQLVSRKEVGNGIYDDKLFMDTNKVFDEPFQSTNAPQTKVVAESLKEVYELMKQCHKPLIYVVDSLPVSTKSLSAIYLLKTITKNPDVIKLPINLTGSLITLPDHTGLVSYENNALTFYPNSDGSINIICGWSDLNYKIDNYDYLVLETNIDTWGQSGVNYSLNGKDFYKIKSDRITISKDQLYSMGLKNINQIYFSTDSINTVKNYTKIYIRNIYLEKHIPYTINYSAYHYVKENGSVKQVDLGDIDLNINQLFYITRDEFLENSLRQDNYIEAIQDTLRNQLGKYLEDNSISLEDTILELQQKLNNIDIKIEEYLSKIELATPESPGLMSPSDKRKLDSICELQSEDLDNILRL